MVGSSATRIHRRIARATGQLAADFGCTTIGFMPTTDAKARPVQRRIGHGVAKFDDKGFCKALVGEASEKLQAPRSRDIARVLARRCTETAARRAACAAARGWCDELSRECGDDGSGNRTLAKASGVSPESVIRYLCWIQTNAMP